MFSSRRHACPTFSLTRGNSAGRERGVVLPASPSFLLLPAALERLKNYHDLPRTTAQALTALKNRLLMNQLLHLYQMYFPDDFRRSEASLRIDEEIGYSPREMEFLRLVGTHLFPLHEDWLPTYVEEVHERFPSIPTCLYARNWWEDPEAHDPGWQLLLVISGTFDQRS